VILCCRLDGCQSWSLIMWALRVCDGKAIVGF
jgi:hypothetical protein